MFPAFPPSLHMKLGDITGPAGGIIDERCGECASCTEVSTSGTCVKGGGLICSGCVSKQKCWRFSPCSFMSDTAQSHFIISQLNLRQKLVDRGSQVIEGHILDRYNMYLDSSTKTWLRVLPPNPSNTHSHSSPTAPPAPLPNHPRRLAAGPEFTAASAESTDLQSPFPSQPGPTFPPLLHSPPLKHP